jgi:hypothetical protein
MAKKTKKKVYMFQYWVEDDKVFREEYTYSQLSKDSPYIHIDLEDDRDVSVDREHVEKDKIEVARTDEGTCIYLYTFKDDVNNALAVIRKVYDELLEEYRKSVVFYENMIATLDATQKRIKEQYPNGVKERKGA